MAQDQTTTTTETCDLCGQLAAPLSTTRCDRCWELERRIQDDPELARRILSSLAPQPPLDAGEWRVANYQKSGMVLAKDGSVIANCATPEIAAQIVADHRSAAAVPKLVQALKQCDGLLVGYRASGVDVSTLARINEVLRVARKAIDEALTTVNQTGGG